MTKLIGVYGAGGCGRGIMPLVRAMPSAAGARLVFIDDSLSVRAVNGHSVISFADFCADPALEKAVALAISTGAVRAQLADRCAAADIELMAVRADNVVQMDDVELGEGALLSPFVTLTSNIRVGRCFQANLYSCIEHDAVIGDFVTFGPGVRCNGNVTIGDYAYIGSGALIRQGLTIGAGATVGMGAVVTKDVAPGVTVVGNPARPLEHGATLGV